MHWAIQFGWHRPCLDGLLVRRMRKAHVIEVCLSKTGGRPTGGGKHKGHALPTVIIGYAGVNKAAVGVLAASYGAFLAAIFIASQCSGTSPAAPAASRFVYDHGAIVRGDIGRKELALVFTGGEYGEGTKHILDVLKQTGLKASFFVTGDFISLAKHRPLIRRMVAEGHYLGPHSQSHPLYCAWHDREKSLVTESFFKEDLGRNIEQLRAFGALPEGQSVYFIPPYEWFNEQHVRWSRDMGITLFSFTPGSGSNRDYIPEGERGFAASGDILRGIFAFERASPHGLNGFLLLAHLGSARRDKMHRFVEPLVDELQARGYRFARVDKLLAALPQP